MSDNPRERAEPVLEVRGVTKVYRPTTVPVHALRGVDLTIDKGEFVSLIGDSGCGKSTLLHIVGGLLHPTDGEVWIEGHSLTQMSDGERTELRRREIGFVFQRFNLFSTLTLEGNLKLAARIYGNGHARDHRFRDEVIDELGLATKKNHKPTELSGGEQQRVAIARAIFHRPAILLADEPTGNLDSENSARVMSMLRRMNERWSQTILMITHSSQAAASASRVLTMSDGRIVDTKTRRHARVATEPPEPKLARGDGSLPP